MGDSIEARGRDEEKKGHKSHRRRLPDARGALLSDRRALPAARAAAPAVYRKAVKSFADGAAMLTRPRIESVEVPYGDKTLPALFVHPDPDAAGKKPAPAMVFFDGFDITKEIQYFKGVPDLAARGIGCLIVDGPGNGESVRFRDLPLIAETEKYATAAYEYLAARREVDPKRIGVMAISLGGYYAPRAASLEPRFAACIAWGAQWDYYDIWKRRFEALDSGKVLSLSVPPEHLMWVFGVDSRAAAMKKLEGFPLGRHRAENEMPVPAGAWRGRRANSAQHRREMLRGGRIEAKDAEGIRRARKAASTIARSTTSRSARNICGTGFAMCSSRDNQRA